MVGGRSIEGLEDRLEARGAKAFAAVVYCLGDASIQDRNSDLDRGVFLSAYDGVTDYILDCAWKKMI
ncbi:hypothetical protein [Nisaea nitritireducens]|uniref:hypothetical protein n=1 Tax=Nisaea nitritireducens TaxID=568392 RepID=UPI001866FE40|nr:hypothetical protein [Nisaea nitritireducens]